MLSKETIEFLKNIWSYQNEEASVVCIVVRDAIKKKIYYKHFYIKFPGGEDRLAKALDEINDFLSKVKKKEQKDILFQVLPLEEEPTEGRGSEEYIKIGKVVWLDLDYKKPIENSDKTYLEEREDGKLEGVVNVEGKYYKVDRPKVSEVLKEIESKLQIRPNYVIDSGSGYHVYFLLDKELDAKRIKDILKRLTKIFSNADKQATDLCRLLRIPGFVNPKYNREVKILYCKEEPTPAEELFASLVVLEREQKKEQETTTLEGEIEGFRELDESKILKIVDIIKPIYKQGYRQTICLYLSGWLAKAKVSPTSAAKIIKTLHEATGDEDSLSERLSTIVYTYKKAGFIDEKIFQKLEEQFGKVYGKEYNAHLEKVKGKSGIYEIAKEILKNEDQANMIIKELSETLDILSPQDDPIWIPLIIEKTRVVYAVADPYYKQIFRISVKDKEIYRKEVIAYAYPKEIEVYPNDKIRITFSSKTRGDIIIGPESISIVAKRAEEIGLVVNSRQWKDILAAIVEAYRKHKKVIVRKEPPEPGFFLKDDTIVAVRYNVPDSIDKEKLTEALLLLNELAEQWFAHVKEKFSLVVRWGIFAPFSYILKKKYGPSRFLRWLYLYGNSKTGKTTLGKIVLKLWGLGTEYSIGGSGANTQARLGAIISKSTFPFLVNEPSDVFKDIGLADMMKNAIENIVARGLIKSGIYEEIPSLASFVFTSNKTFPEDDALQRRFYILTFTYSKRIPEEKQNEFKIKVEPRLEILSRVGEFVAYYVMNNQKEFLEEIAQKEPLEVSAKILKEAYKFCGLEVPDWIDLNVEVEDEDPKYVVIEKFLIGFRKIVDEAYVHNFKKMIIQKKEGQLTIPDIEEKDAGDVPFKDKLEVLLDRGYLSSYGIFYFKRKRTVGFTKTFLNIIDLRELPLESFGEIVFGIGYVKSTRTREGPIKCIDVPIDELYSFLEKYEMLE